MRAFFRPAFLLLLFGGIQSFAQLAGLATTDDGSVLVFRSTMRLQGSSDADEDKIYRWDGNFSVIAKATGPTRAPTQSNQPHFNDPFLSGDGTILVFYEDPGCILCQT